MGDDENKGSAKHDCVSVLEPDGVLCLSDEAVIGLCLSDEAVIGSVG